ncbi:MAG: hypothetical protein J7K12_06165 [Thermoplasmata archaeon]|nr:hypothetical protein [Thermoplasmata archaeon]
MGMIWKDEFFNGIWNVAKFANDELELLKSRDKILEIYMECHSFLDFYERTKSIMEPAHGNSIFFSRRLSKIVNFVSKKMEKGKKAKLWCYQQAILMAAGIKAVYSEWSNDIGKFIGKGDFEFKFYVGRKERSHVELVISKWNGKKIKAVSMDTHLEEHPFSWKGNARYLNSVMKTIQIK